MGYIVRSTSTKSNNEKVSSNLSQVRMAPMELLDYIIFNDWLTVRCLLIRDRDK